MGQVEVVGARYESHLPAFIGVEHGDVLTVFEDVQASVRYAVVQLNRQRAFVRKGRATAGCRLP